VQVLRAGKSVTCFEDEWRTPISLASAAEALIALARSDFEGLLHIGGPERLSRLDMGLRLAERLGADPTLIVAGRRNQIAAAEHRPRDLSLKSGKWRRHFAMSRWLGMGESLAEMGGNLL
jgi:dTDP-4-dehydrorhamnose reductase